MVKSLGSNQEVPGSFEYFYLSYTCIINLWKWLIWQNSIIIIIATVACVTRQ